MDNILQNPFWNILISAFVGGIIGLIISRVFDRPLERWQRKTMYGIREVISRLQGATEIAYGYDQFRIGKWRADWVIVEGSSSDPYTPNNVVCQLDPTPVVLPPDLYEKKSQVEKVQSDLE